MTCFLYVVGAQKQGRYLRTIDQFDRIGLVVGDVFGTDRFVFGEWRRCDLNPTVRLWFLGVIGGCVHLPFDGMSQQKALVLPEFFGVPN